MSFFGAEFFAVLIGMEEIASIISLCNTESNWISLTAGWIVGKFLLRRLCNNLVCLFGLKHYVYYKPPTWK